MLENISDTIWADKYRLKTPEGEPVDLTTKDTDTRVVNAVYINDNDKAAKIRAFDMLHDRFMVPGGRIIAGAGSPYPVTLINCFVNRDVEDSLQGILDAHNDTMKTMQKGGGIGTNFSTLRPKDATVKGYGTKSSGPISFMGMWDAGCKTISSAGNRRGAMMATLRCDHPDVIDFIHAKTTAGVLTQFNLSVMVTDAFMAALAAGEDWDLGFKIPRADNNHVEVLERDGEPWYVYKRLPAKELWDLIIRNTYEYAEPGLLFIDRINDRNNLKYCETISATNPCGEQPLPPFGDCNLGAMNFSKFVINPFTDDARFDFEAFTKYVADAVRFLDNVLDVTHFPLDEQREEALSKRRIGLGPMGIGTMLMMMKIPYGQKAVPFLDKVMDAFAEAAYEASALLAKERGAFPLYNKDEFLKSYNVKKRSKRVRDLIAKHGIRNGVLLTVAPTGTTATYAGNVSGGLEPAFSLRYTRKVRQPDDSTIDYDVADGGFVAYCEANGFNPSTHSLDDLPDYMATAQQLPVEDHLAVMAVCQQYIDASISKTINCPEDMKFEDFEQVYMQAWEMGCKGCTTYRPSGVRGSVLVSESDKKKAAAAQAAATASKKFKRPDELVGKTYKVKTNTTNLYVTVNNTELVTVSGESFEWPIEIFIRSQSPADNELMDALAITITALLRQTAALKVAGLLPTDAGMDFLFEHLRTIQSPDQGVWHNGKYVPSRPALISKVLEGHFKALGETSGDVEISEVSSEDLAKDVSQAATPHAKGDVCNNCGSHSVIREEGCLKCTECLHSRCS